MFMGFKEFLGLKQAKQSIAKIGVFAPSILTEQFKGQTARNEVRFPKELGEEHPFDFSVVEGIYKKFGFVTGVIDKYVDFVIGPGFYVESKDQRAKDLIEQFMKDNDFATLMRAWLKEGLVKGNGFLEIGGSKGNIPQGLKVLNANNMFVSRNEVGEVQKYRQYVGMIDKFAKNKTIDFNTWQIAHLRINTVGDDAYGMGLVFPAMNTINNLLGSEKDMHKILSRKAGAPIHAKIGDKDHLPTADAVDDFGKKLESMHNLNEWATDGMVEMKVLDFGNIGEKFDIVNRYNLDMLFFTFQVPEVLMGRGSIPEGLAKVQMDAFERRIQSIQDELEKVIEQQIFKRVLLANKLDVHVEFQWGQPSNTEKNEKLLRLTELLKLLSLDLRLRAEIEKDVAKLLGYDAKKLETPAQEREREESQPQPMVPGSNEVFRYGTNEAHSANSGYPLAAGDTSSDDISLAEWVNFSYREYLADILSRVWDDKYDNLKADNREQVEAGYFTTKQVGRLRNVLDDGFRNGQSIRTIAGNVAEKVKPHDLFRTDDSGKVILDEDGMPTLKLSKEERPIIIARTETIRLANEGTKKNFLDNGIKEYRWVASISERTCPTCRALNGQIFELNGPQPLPGAIHAMCRCSMAAVTRL